MTAVHSFGWPINERHEGSKQISYRRSVRIRPPGCPSHWRKMGNDELKFDGTVWFMQFTKLATTANERQHLLTASCCYDKVEGDARLVCRAVKWEKLVLGSVVAGSGRSVAALADVVKDFSLRKPGLQAKDVPLHRPRIGCFICSSRMMQPVPGRTVVESLTQGGSLRERPWASICNAVGVNFVLPSLKLACDPGVDSFAPSTFFLRECPSWHCPARASWHSNVYGGWMLLTAAGIRVNFKLSMVVNMWARDM